MKDIPLRSSEVEPANLLEINSVHNFVRWKFCAKLAGFRDFGAFNRTTPGEVGSRLRSFRGPRFRRQLSFWRPSDFDLRFRRQLRLCDLRAGLWRQIGLREFLADSNPFRGKVWLRQLLRGRRRLRGQIGLG
jgi:hypothetical protein